MSEARAKTYDELLNELIETKAALAYWRGYATGGHPLPNDGVPWASIKRMLGDIGCANRKDLNSTLDDFSDVLGWWCANAPKEPANE